MAPKRDWRKVVNKLKLWLIVVFVIALTACAGGDIEKGLGEPEPVSAPIAGEADYLPLAQQQQALTGGTFEFLNLRAAVGRLFSDPTYDPLVLVFGDGGTPTIPDPVGTTPVTTSCVNFLIAPLSGDAPENWELAYQFNASFCEWDPEDAHAVARLVNLLQGNLDVVCGRLRVFSSTADCSL